MSPFVATLFLSGFLLWNGRVSAIENRTKHHRTTVEVARCGRNVQAQDYLNHITRELNRHLVSWPRLKRQAGYFTESHVYRGGLYKEAIDEEYEFYGCVSHDEERCFNWTANEKSRDEAEFGSCHCFEQDEHYCREWHCTQIEIAFDVSCGDFGCSDEVQYEETNCECSQASSNNKYCEKWNCIETGSDGNLETEEYTCLEENESGEYCHFWTGSITSETEIETSACTCVCNEAKLCTYWICKERGIERCQVHRGWCDMGVAVGVGGGFGAGFMLVSLGLVPPYALRHERILTLVFTSFFGCLPWTAGVVIWGGLRSLPWVSMIWTSTFMLSLAWIYYITRYS